LGTKKERTVERRNGELCPFAKEISPRKKGYAKMCGGTGSSWDKQNGSFERTPGDPKGGMGTQITPFVDSGNISSPRKRSSQGWPRGIGIGGTGGYRCQWKGTKCYSPRKRQTMVQKSIQKGWGHSYKIKGTFTSKTHEQEDWKEGRKKKNSSVGRMGSLPGEGGRAPARKLPKKTKRTKNITPTRTGFKIAGPHTVGRSGKGPIGNRGEC